VKLKEMREKSAEELQHLLAGWREEMFNLKIQSMTGQVEQYSRVKTLRRTIARALTILREDEKSAPAPGAERGKS
jgi:large subunit ribosomal protein L29